MMSQRPFPSGFLLEICLLLMLGAGACTPVGGDPNRIDGGNPDGGPGADGIVILDSTTMDKTPIAMAVGPSDRIGVAYFRNATAPNFDIRYLEWKNGQVTTNESVQTVRRVEGVSVAFQPNGQPAVAYLGGGDDGTGSLYWVQSDAAISYRQQSGAWSESIAVRLSNEAYCGNPVSDNGFVVGLFPGLVFAGPTAYLVYRDVHQGQFPNQDWAGSDMEVVSGSPSSWTHTPVQCGGNDKQAYGGHVQVVLGAQNQPAVVSDKIFGSADGPGTSVLFHIRNSDSTWSNKPTGLTIGNTQWGASLAYDSSLGYAIAVLDKTNDALFFTSSTDTNQWTTPDPVFQTGSGGWYPSVAIDPSTHEPNIAYYICSVRPGVVEGSCPANENQLKITVRVLGNWRHSVIDPRGGIGSKLAFLSTGKRAIAYRDPISGGLKLFVEP